MEREDVVKEQVHLSQLNQKFDKAAEPKRRSRAVVLKKSDRDAWHDAMMCVMSNLQVKSPDAVARCADTADAYVKLLNEKFK